jgi:hypothetical protein
MKGQPFKRINTLVGIVNLLAGQQNTDKDALKQAWANLYGYKSRGKGKGKTQAAPIHKHMSLVRSAKHRKNVSARSKK